MFSADVLDPVEEHDRQSCLDELHVLDTPAEPAFDDLASYAAEFCATPMAAVTFLGSEREWLKSHIGLSLEELPRNQALSAQAIQQRNIVVVPDTSKDARFRDHPLVTREPHIRFVASCPFFSSEGSPLGAICVLDRTPHQLTERQQNWLKSLSRDLGRLLELRREVYVNHRHNEEQATELEQTRLRLQEQAQKHERFEKQLQDRERQLADAERIAHLGSWEWNLATGEVTWTEELYRIFGLAPGEFQGTYEAYLEHIHPDDRMRIDELVQGARKSNSAFIGEHRVIRPDGAVRTIYCCGEVVSDDQPEPTRLVCCCHDITERRAMQQCLECSLSLLNATLEATADGILVADLERKVQRWNRKFIHMWNLPNLRKGSDHTDIVADVVPRLIDPEQFIPRLRAIYDHPDQDSFDLLEFTDGRTFERYSQPQRLGSEIVGRVWSFRDITSRTLALKTLRQSEERYRTLVVATSHVVWCTTPEGDLLEDSSSWRAFSGQTYEAMRGRGWLEAVHPKDRARTSETWAHALAARSLYQIECRLRRADGEWRDMLIRSVPVLRADGTVREWIAVLLDVTEHKHAQQIIVQERDFSNALINSLPGIFYVLDSHGLNLRWNNNLEAITEFSRAEISRMRATDFVPPEERELVKHRVGQVFQTGRADVELSLTSKSGQRTPFYCTGVLVTINRKPHLVGVGIDISGLKHAQAEIQRLNADLEKRVAERTAAFRAANEELEAFIYTASHDLRSPIRAIVSFATAVHEDYKTVLADEGRLYLERIIKAGDRMLQLIDDLLEYSRVGHGALHIRPVVLREFLTEIEAEFGMQLKAIGAELSITADIPRVLADPSLLTQIFRNLLQNAITYRQRDVPLRIAIVGTRENSEAIIKVRDNGIGIEPQHFAKIFEVFHQLHPQAPGGGTGIGLATVKKAVDVLGGTITVESTPGQGSTFNVSLPLAPSPQPPQEPDR